VDFYHKAGRYYWNAIPRNAQPLNNSNVRDRHCLQCGFKNGEYEPGLRLNVAGGSWMLCAGCSEFEKYTTPCPGYAYNKTCTKCNMHFSSRREHGLFLRFLQWAFSIIIFSLACTGGDMPTTSVVSRHSLRWIFTVLTCLLTIGATMNSLIIRLQAKSFWTYRSKRAENGKFSFGVECVATLAWLGVLASVVNEGIHRHFRGSFDKFARVMTAMIVLECFLFIISTMWGYRTNVRLRGRKLGIIA